MLIEVTLKKWVRDGSGEGGGSLIFSHLLLFEFFLKNESASDVSRSV